MNNVNFVDLKHIDDRAHVGENVTLYPNSFIIGDSEIGDNVTIYPNCVIIDSKIGSNTVIRSSHIEGAVVGKDCKMKKNGTLIDVAPTYLDLLGLENSKFFEGKSLIIDNK